MTATEMTQTARPVRSLDPVALARVRLDVNAAARGIGPLWPLRTVIAVNPLGDLVESGFEAAGLEAARWLGASWLPGRAQLRAAFTARRIMPADIASAVDRRHPELSVMDARSLVDRVVATLCDDHDPASVEAARINERSAAERADASLGADIASLVDDLVAGWCALFVDLGGTTWSMPNRELGFYESWRRLAPHDPTLRRLFGRAAQASLAELPTRPERVIIDVLDEWSIDEHRRRDELRGQLSRLPGWVGHARWRNEWAASDELTPRLELTDLVAVRLTIERLALEAVGYCAPDDHTAPPGMAHDDVGMILLDAYEANYRDKLLISLTNRGVEATTSGRRPAAQVVCCIDVRSEGLRRHLEAIGPYETIGFAGFFGVAVKVRSLGARHAHAQCPVLVNPQIVVEEHAAPGYDNAVAHQLDVWHRQDAAWSAIHTAKRGVGSGFTLAEISGWIAGPIAALRTFRPRRSLRQRHSPDAQTVETVDRTDGGLGFTSDEQVLVAETALRTMGLTANFAPIVVLCGHGGRTTNNPYASSLDCGACGGNPGGHNARVAADILNHLEVRLELRDRGIEIPDDTVFIAAEHDTTTDTIDVLDRHRIDPQTQRGLVRIEADLAIAGQRLAAERTRSLPGSGRVVTRANDWAEVRPEWGLARNAAFIVGPRAMTRGLDLECRAFLHSYAAGDDHSGRALETILTAPMVVAQWINAQYYFSTVDPDVFGAGDKTLHNPVAGIGVVVGSGGDLRVGLPKQSLFDGDRPHHEPMRLLTVVEAPLDRIGEIIDRNDVLRHLFDGNWVTLAARPGPDEPFRIRIAGGGWVEWKPSTNLNEPTDTTTEVAE